MYVLQFILKVRFIPRRILVNITTRMHVYDEIKYLMIINILQCTKYKQIYTI